MERRRRDTELASTHAISNLDEADSDCLGGTNSWGLEAGNGLQTRCRREVERRFAVGTLRLHPAVGGPPGCNSGPQAVAGIPQWMIR